MFVSCAKFQDNSSYGSEETGDAPLVSPKIGSETPSVSETGLSRAMKAIVSRAVCLGFSMEMTSIAVKNKRQLYGYMKASNVVIRFISS